MNVTPSSISLNGHGWIVAEGVGVSDGMGVKKTVGRAVLVARGGRVVAVGPGVRVGSGVHVAGEMAVTSTVGFGVGVFNSATAVGSGLTSACPGRACWYTTSTKGSPTTGSSLADRAVSMPGLL